MAAACDRQSVPARRSSVLEHAPPVVTHEPGGQNPHKAGQNHQIWLVPVDLLLQRGIEGLPAVIQAMIDDMGGDSRLPGPDRKCTRPNSSHVRISYAVFCLK